MFCKNLFQKKNNLPDLSKFLDSKYSEEAIRFLKMCFLFLGNRRFG